MRKLSITYLRRLRTVPTDQLKRSIERLQQMSKMTTDPDRAALYAEEIAETEKILAERAT